MRRSTRRLALIIAAIPLVLVGAVLALFVAFAIYVGEPKPPLPPLLEGATAGGGWGGTCPDPETDALWRNQPLALSPELDQRLRDAFPAGSSERDLLQTLAAQGFELHPPCESDPTVRFATFRQEGGLYPLGANVVWQVDSTQTLVWTRGFVWFTGP